MAAHLILTLLPDTFAICRLDADAAVPAWATTGGFFSISRTAEELSIVCLQSLRGCAVSARRSGIGTSFFRASAMMPVHLALLRDAASAITFSLANISGFQVRPQLPRLGFRHSSCQPASSLSNSFLLGLLGWLMFS